jgi:hypothetical protein
MQEHATSLLDVALGETVRVRRVFFDSPRDYCAELGLHEGDRVTLLEDQLSNLLLQEAGGRIVRCPSEFARFVEVVRDQRQQEQLEASQDPESQRQ